MLEHKRKRLKINEVAEAITCPVCKMLAEQAQQEVPDICEECGGELQPVKDLPKETPQEKVADDSKLEELKEHITELVDYSKEIEDNRIITESLEDFLKMAEEFKSKLDVKEEEKIKEKSLGDLGKICQECMKNYDKGQKPLISEKAKTKNKQELPLAESTATVKFDEHPTTDGKLCELHAQMESDLELGTFETEVQEITKIVRVKNDDGTVTEEKKIIIIKKETRAPLKSSAVQSLTDNQSTSSNAQERLMFQASDASGKSNTYSSNKTIQTVTLKIPNILNSIRSNMATQSSLTESINRACVSSGSLSLSTSFKAYDYQSSEKFSAPRSINFMRNSTHSIQLYGFEKNGAGNIGSVTNSERDLLENLSQTIYISKSNNEVSKNLPNFRVRRTVSVNIKNRRNGSL